MMNILDIFALVTYNWLFIKAIGGYGINLAPKNGEYCTGGNITMTCTITGAPENWPDPAKDLIFKYNDELVQSSLVMIINATTAQYFITDKVPDKNNFCVECCYKKCPASKNYTNSVAVKGFVQPVEVQNLTCIIKGIFSGPIHCTWDYGVDYTKSWNKPDVYFIWRRSRYLKWTREKLDSVANNSKDFANSSKIGYFTAEVGVNVTSSHCASKAVYMKYSSIKTVQLPAVTNLTAVPLTNRCSEITWHQTTIDRTFNKSCSINCTNNWNVPMNKVFNICKTGVKLCEMIPNTTYTCTVKVKVNRPTGSYIPWSHAIWSEGRSTTVHTLDDDKSPAVTDGAFMWENQDCSSKHTMSPVWIYWKPVEPRYHNGRLNGTLLTYVMDTEENGTIANVSAHAARLLLDCEQSQTVVLQSVNNIGLSIASSQLQISPLNQDVIELIVEEDQLNTTVMSLEWDYSEHKQVNTFTVFYAAKTKNSVTCSSESLNIVKWKNVSGTENKTEITISKRPHCYGLSVQTANGSSGLRWTDCVYAKNAVPKPPEEVNVTDRGDNSLVVRWSKTPCSTSQPYIKWYQIKYCPVTSKGTCGHIISCSSSTSSLILDHLVTGTKYNISVRAVTRFNVTGNWSKTIAASPIDRSIRLETEKVKNTIAIVVSVLSSVPVILLVIIIVTYARRKWNKYVASSTGVENIPVLPGLPHDANGNTDIPGKSSSGKNTYLVTNGLNRTQYNFGFLADNDHRPTSGDKQGANMNSYSMFDKYDYSEVHLMLTGSRQNPDGDANTSMAAGDNTFETPSADVHVTNDTRELDSELGGHNASEMYPTVARAEHDSAQKDHNKLDENAPDTYIKVEALATVEHKLEQRHHKLDESKHVLNATDTNENDGDIENSMLTEITEAETAERITNADVKTSPATLNTAKNDQAEQPRFESLSLQSDIDIKDSVAKNTLLVKNANEQFSKLPDNIEMGPKTTVVCQENDLNSVPDDFENRHAEDHINNHHMGYVTADHSALKGVHHLKSTAETESKEMGDTAKSYPEKLSESVVSVSKSDNKKNKSHSAETESKEVENESKEMGDTTKSYPEKLRKSMVSVNKTDDEESKSHSAETESKDFENKSKEMGDTAEFHPEKLSKSVVSVNETDDKGNKSHSAETESKEMENKSKEMGDTAKFHAEKMSESVVSINETDDKENESHSVEEYMTSEQISNIIMNDMPRNPINTSSYQLYVAGL